MFEVVVACHIDLDEVAVVVEKEGGVEEYPFLWAAFGSSAVVSRTDLFERVWKVVEDGLLEDLRKLVRMVSGVYLVLRYIVRHTSDNGLDLLMKRLR